MQGKGTQSGPAQALEQNRAAISKLAQSGDAQRLMELLRQGGGVEQAAQAAAAGDPAALMAMMDRLMHTPEGAALVDRIGTQAKQAGLE
ncbi:hypothetical protein ACTQ3Z_05065 [Lawsonibacter sp. LCP25S3_F5]|jgi:hypothetical protein